MKKKMVTAAAIIVLLTAGLTIAYINTFSSLLLPLAITCATISYHLVMRLLVGFIFNVRMGNKADYSRPWYRQRPWEKKVYDKLQVKKWKDKMPSYDVSLFDPDKRSLKELAGAMCQAELVHETIAVLCFLPILAGIWFGAWPVFIITSFVSAAFDLSFVIMQRYNRPRVIRLIERSRK